MKRVLFHVVCCCLLGHCAASVRGAEVLVHPDRPNEVKFSAVEARFVRFVIHRSSASQACIDELEIYGEGGNQNLALASRGGKASASSCLPGYAIHQIPHLNDGLYGNSHSWIAATTGTEWAQVKLPRPETIARVVFSRDRAGRYADRVPVHFEIRLSLDGETWTTVKRIEGRSTAPPPPRPRGAVPAPPRPLKKLVLAASSGAEDRFRYAVLGEEHAWLKTHGRADLDRRLTGYIRVKNYPRHVGDDRLPLPPLSSLPKLDGKITEPCWDETSRGVVRVAWPYEFDGGPLVEYALRAGWREDDLYLAIRTNRLLSAEIAEIHAGGKRIGDLKWSAGGLLFNSRPVAGAHDDALSSVEVRLPLSLLPGSRTGGISVRMGIGGKHTPRGGLPVHLDFSRLSIAQCAPCVNGVFRVRLGLAPGTEPAELEGNAAELLGGLTLSPGESRVISIPAQGPIGPEHELRVNRGNAESYTLHLFRYDPLGRTLAQLSKLVERVARRGVDVAGARAELSALRGRHEALMEAEVSDPAAEREAFLEARRARRRVFFSDPDLAPLEKILFVKRQAFRPSHNYSVILDAPFRPGGGVYLLEIPRLGRQLLPDDAKIVSLFDAKGGIARNPMADFVADTIYFGYRPSEPGYFHVMRMNADGSDLEQVTDGPFHDYWPCPLPDGGLAFISTRCRARFLCWRPQAAVLFRMNGDGSDIRPLSFANLTEWGPSVLDDGRIIWQRSEYIDKGADFSHTLWTIRPDGTRTELVFGNTIIQPNGYANGRQVPGTNEISCTLISHFGDLNGPIALVDLDKGKFNPKAITSITPEVPWPGWWPAEECFRDPVPVARDYFLCSHAPRDRFGLYVIDRFGNRELLHADPDIGSMCPTPFRPVPRPPVIESTPDARQANRMQGQFTIADVYRGISPTVPRGTVKYLRVVEEVRAELIQLPSGDYQKDHTPFQDWYATPIHKVSGPFGWPSYVAKATHGIVAVEDDGSANFLAPAGRQLYFEILDEDFNELQRMRSVVQLQPGERRSCIGCHEDRRTAPPVRQAKALLRAPSELEPPPWGAGAFSYEHVVQPVLDAKCSSCHDEKDERRINLTGTPDQERVPASYRTLIQQGWVHHLDFRYNPGGNEKRQPLTFGTVKSKLWAVLNKGHHDVEFTRAEMRAIKCWIDLNCPLWPDYTFRLDRPSKIVAARR